MAPNRVAMLEEKWMIFLLCTIPLIAYVSKTLFEKVGFTAINFKGKIIPYNLGMIVIYSYALSFYMYRHETDMFTTAAFIYIVGIWLLGFIDDIFGIKEPKGIKGHFTYAYNHSVMTTGLVKMFGTIVFALGYVFTLPQKDFRTTVLTCILLVGFPYVMNAFDTKPLRVWKVSFLWIIAHSFIFQVISIHIIFIVVLLCYILFSFEAKEIAMLGDNGATVIGAMIALIVIHYSVPVVSYSAVAFVIVIGMIAERSSISLFIDRFFILKKIDQLGQRK